MISRRSIFRLVGAGAATAAAASIPAQAAVSQDVGIAAVNEAFRSMVGEMQFGQPMWADAIAVQQELNRGHSERLLRLVSAPRYHGVPVFTVDNLSTAEPAN